MAVNRRRFLCLAAPIALVALEAGRAAAITRPSPRTTPGTDGDAIELPLDPATPILRLTSAGGFVPAGWDFSAPPELVITAGGDVYRAGVMTMEFPGPLLQPIDHQQLTPAGVQRVLGAAKRAGLFEPPPDYDDVEIMVTDVPSTVVTITTAAGSVVHSATALGMNPQGDGKEQTPARQALLDFVNAIRSLDTMVGAELSRATGFVPSEFRMIALPVNVADWAGNDPQPVVKPWPQDTGVRLATAAECTRVPAAKVDTLFAGASQLTFFDEDGLTYQVSARGVLPGDPTC